MEFGTVVRSVARAADNAPSVSLCILGCLVVVIGGIVGEVL